MSEEIPTRSAKKQEAKKGPNLAGRYRVREGYTVGHGKRLNEVSGETIGEHARAVAGEIVDLSHEEALSIIKSTMGQKNPETGRPHGPAIETEEAYETRVAAEQAHDEFMKQLTESNNNPLLNG